jgi:Undecaprenyl-phosphate glucose phosphotransferase
MLSPLNELTDRRTSPLSSRIARYVAVSYNMLSICVGAFDTALIIISSICSHLLYTLIWRESTQDVSIALGIGLVAGSIYSLLEHSWGLLRIDALLSPSRHRSKVILAWIIAVLMLTAVLFLFKLGGDFSRATIISFGLLSLVVLLGSRPLICSVLGAFVSKGAIAGRRSVVIGHAMELSILTGRDLLIRFGLKEVGRISLPPEMEGGTSTERVLDKLDKAIELARELGAEELVLALPWNNQSLLEIVSTRLRQSPLSVRLLPDDTVRATLGRRTASVISPTLSVELQRSPLSRVERLAKRSLDLVLALGGTLILSPLLLVTALAVKADSAGPVLFRQRRTGFDGHQFSILKFRTMHVQEDGPDVPQARKNDPRVTRLGRLLRQSSIDELPQLLNVIRGDMSLVGPRPHALAHDDIYRDLIATYSFRHHVKPGITGWAQVNGLRGETRQLGTMQRRVELDIWYVNNWSMVLDLQIIFRTCFEVLKNRAY